MKRVSGAAAFGLNDKISHTKGGCLGPGFFLADAVLPRNPLGSIRTGNEAEGERVHSGLGWPKEARISLSEPLRRVPAACAWTLLVEAGDTHARWLSASGGSFYLASILAEHIGALLLETEKQDDEPDELVVAIPDHLDEFGQESLLRELRHKLRIPTRLIWRPVSAALAWLDQVQDDLGELKRMDWVAVFFLGADSIECTGFRLQEREHEGKRYVLPVRERPTEPPGPSGVDWAVDVMGSLLELDTRDPGAFWQAFTSFPEVWQAIAGRSWDAAALPRAWSKDGGWEKWLPPSSLAGKVANVLVAGGEPLWRIFSNSCSVCHTPRRGKGREWLEYLVGEVTKLVERMRGGRLRGVVVCGPLAPSQAARPLLTSFGLTSAAQPSADRLWLAAEDEDPVANGARIYGERLALSLPTYLDTLPQISTLAVDNGEYTWVNLVEATTCEGGQPYTNKINNNFQLKKDCNYIEVFLQRKQRANFPTPEELVPTQGLSPAWIEQARNTVRNFQNFEAVRQYRGWDGNSQYREYILQYAEAHFACLEQKHAPYRKGKMRFPSAPVKDTVIDLNVEMRPASGLAQVEFLPRDKEFLRGRRVFFDYSRMEDAHELPKLKRGWPDILKMELSKDSDALRGHHCIERFLASSVRDYNYEQLLDGAKIFWTTSVQEFEGSNWVWKKKVDQDGIAGSREGQKVVDNLRHKLGDDFVKIKSEGRHSRLFEMVIKRGTWLWGGTPQEIVNYLEIYFGQRLENYPRQWLWYTEAASRCFKEIHQFNLLFSSIYARLKSQAPGMAFPIQTARSVYRAIMYREMAYSALNDEQVNAFLNESLKILKHQLDQGNIKQKFLQGVLLFFVLLRYRKKNPNFMNPDVSSYAGEFEQLEEYLEKAKERIRISNPSAASRIADLLDAIMAYVRFEGAPGIIEILVQEADGN